MLIFGYQKVWKLVTIACTGVCCFLFGAGVELPAGGEVAGCVVVGAAELGVGTEAGIAPVAPLLSTQ